MKPTFRIRKGLSGRYHFVLEAPNSEIIGTSVSLKTAAECELYIEETRSRSQELKNFALETSVAKEPYFNLWSADQDHVLLKSEMYSGIGVRVKGIRGVMNYAPIAEIIYE